MLRAQLLHNHNGHPAVSAKNHAGVVHIRILPIAFVDYLQGERAYRQGALIQDAFPSITSSDAEFLKTGLTPMQWHEIFGDSDEDDDPTQLDDLLKNGHQFLTPEQYQKIYAGELALEEAYCYNEKRIRKHLEANQNPEEAAASPGV